MSVREVTIAYTSCQSDEGHEIHIIIMYPSSCVSATHSGGQCLEPKNSHCEENKKKQRNLTAHCYNG